MYTRCDKTLKTLYYVKSDRHKRQTLCDPIKVPRAIQCTVTENWMVVSRAGSEEKIKSIIAYLVNNFHVGREGIL